MRDVHGNPLVPGYNVDKINIQAGMQEAFNIGYDTETEQMVVEYALMRWARGEEEAAMNNMRLDAKIGLTSIYRIVAAARTGAL